MGNEHFFEGVKLTNDLPENKIFLDYSKFIDDSITFYVIPGGRGIGKTYGALDIGYQRALHDPQKKFFYLRRRDNAIKAVATVVGNPFKKLNADKGYNVLATYSDKSGLGVFYKDDKADATDIDSDYEEENEDKKLPNKTVEELVSKDKPIIGYASALSTVGKIRGLDFSDVDLIIFDECVQVRGEMPLKDDSDLLFNLYETVNRNREFLGESPVKLLMLSNSVTTEATIYTGLGINRVLQHMVYNNMQRWTDKERSIRIIRPKSPKFKDLKQQTALYKLIKGTTYYNHAIDNEFINDDYTNVGKRNIMEYTPVFAIDGLYVYQHKTRAEQYVSTIEQGLFKEVYSIADRKMCQRIYKLPFSYLHDKGVVYYETFEVKVRILELLAYTPPKDVSERNIPAGKKV